MKRILAATGAVIALSAAPAFAQDATQPNLLDSMLVIEESVSAEMSRLGLEVDTDDLTMRQIREIHLVLEDQDLSDDDERDQIEQIIMSPAQPG